MDIIRAFLQLKDIDCFVATETWFSENHIDPLIAVQDYCCFRDDRCGRIGGGVAIWSKVNFCPQKICISEKPPGIEVVVVALNCKMFIIGCYIPPQVVSSSHDLVSDFLIDLIDTLLIERTSFDVMLCGDFNRLEMDFICRNCNLLNKHNCNTYGKAELDYILISENIASFYSVTKADPIDVSVVHHASLLAVPSIVRKSHLKLSRQVFDLRDSNVTSFVQQLNQCDWSFIRNECLDLNEKCVVLHGVLNDAFSRTIPVKYVTFTDNSKPWITPLVKSLINDCWKVYREKNFQLYSHLKSTVKKEIEKSKSIWA